MSIRSHIHISPIIYEEADSAAGYPLMVRAGLLFNIYSIPYEDVFLKEFAQWFRRHLEYISE